MRPSSVENNMRTSYVSPTTKSYYFTELTFSKGFFYAATILFVVLFGAICMFEAFLDVECDEEYTVKFANPAYNENPCRHVRQAKLFFLTSDECSFGRRLLMSAIFGSVIGWERRQADRPAGIRTMSLVSLGACLFTIDGTYAMLNGPMEWDASRISAAIPSGVGFLGAGLIFKESERDPLTGEKSNVVHGLTTAASVWLSAAVGVACGGELYFAAIFGIAITLVMLRFGPRASDDEDDDDDDEQDLMMGPGQRYSAAQLSSGGPGNTKLEPDLEKGDTETSSLVPGVKRLSARKSMMRSRRQLDTRI